MNMPKQYRSFTAWYVLKAKKKKKGKKVLIFPQILHSDEEKINTIKEVKDSMMCSLNKQTSLCLLCFLADAANYSL